MAEQKESPYICHVFICTHDREGKKKSCADGDSSQIRKELKAQVGDRGWKGRVRVSQSGCMGLCANGPNVMIYPQKIWFSNVSLTDVDIIISQVAEIMKAH